jgi:hypothetical protein
MPNDQEVNPVSKCDTQFPVVHRDALELAGLLRPSWPIYSAALRRKPTLVCEGGEGGGGGEGGEGGGGGSATGAITFSSQEDFDRAMGRRLAKEREGITKKYGDLDELQKKAKEYDDIQAAGQSELEKAQAKIAELEQVNGSSGAELRQARLEEKIAALAPAKGIVDVDLALAALDRSDIKVEWDGNGQPKDVAGVVDELLKQRPALAGKGASTGFGGGTRGNGSGGGASMDDLIRQRARG